MSAGLITLPLRLGIRGVGLALGVTERAVSVAWSAVETFVPGRGGASAAPERPFPREETDNGGAPGAAEPERDPRADFELGDPRVASREAPPEPELRSEVPPPAAPEAAAGAEHVDTEATIVESFAEPGAEDGAGAAVRIAEPWDGYARQTAEEITGRLADAPAEVLAAVELYEAANKGRATVLATVERHLQARAAG